MASVSDVAATGSANAALAGGAIIAGGGAVAMAGAAAATSSSTSATGVQISETMQVMYNYVPNLSDEIYLYVNDPVIVKTKFDDGWAFGYNMTTKQEGSFPLACVGPYDKENNNSKGGPRAGGSADFGSRGSSLYLNEKYASGLSRLRESTTANGVTTIAPPPGGGGGVSTAGSGVPSNQRTYPSLYNSMYQS